ncbi:MAG: Zn-dependent exopeptidase M28, partial [Proteobacteria bacterium]
MGLLRLSSLLCFATLTWGSFAHAAGRYGLAPLDALEDIQQWAEADASRVWVAGESSVFYSDKSSARQKLPFGEGRWTPIKGETYFFYGAHELPIGAREILRGGRTRLIESPITLGSHVDHHGGVRPMRANVELSVKKPKNRELTLPSMGQWIDGVKWRADVEQLSSWNRYSYGTGINESRLWLEEQFAQLPGMVLTQFPFSMPRGEGLNVIATLPGTSRPDEVYIVGAHYDSTSEKPTVSAPGAEDNGSGTAGLLALARVFAANPPAATIIFVGFSGEEQGLYGSKAWTRDWLKNSAQDSIKAVLIMDMIGYSGDSEQDVLLETSSLTKPLLATINKVNADPELAIYESFDYWGSDHEPFLDNGIPASAALRR